MSMNILMMHAGVMVSMAKMKAREIFCDETGAVDLVTIVVLMGVAVLLAIVFKDSIGKLIESLLDTITGNATGAVNNPAGSGAGAGSSE